MALSVGKEAPFFKADAVFGDNTFGEVCLTDFIDKKYLLLYFYPLDFTFVCPSEIIALDKALDSFKERNVELIGCSVDSKFAHLAWKNTPLKYGGIGKIKHTLISDITKSISRDYGVLFDDSIALRGLFLIDKKGIVQHALINNLEIGRSVDEILRTIDALQHHEQYGDVCPANWTKGKKSIKPSKDGILDYLSNM